MSDTESPGDRAVPDLVPARMVNEAAYCPRLFYLEWVQGRFEDNADTVEGSWVHRRVDRPSGRVPDAAAVLEMGEARSVSVSSERLGLVAKIDLLEGDGSSVVPVDYKKGSVPAVAERSREPERVQLCVQGLILQDNGYACNHGVLWFAGSKERVTVEFDEGLVARTLEIVALMRQLGGSSDAPPPLVHSPKCPRCSLVGLCLPDEHNLLSERTARRPRRLIPANREGMPLYVTEPGAVVGVRGGRLEVTLRKERLASVRAIDVSQVCAFGNVQVTTQALQQCFEDEVLVCFFTGGGWLRGIASGLPSKHVQLRRRQHLLSPEDATAVSCRFVEGKVRNCRTLLMRNGQTPSPDAVRRLAGAVEECRGAHAISSLLGIEGAAARSYFAEMPSMLREDIRLPGSAFAFDGRNRRPPKDPVNALLSFVYALLVKDLLAACVGVGLDPYVGAYHRPRFGRPALALDLAEEFRPLIGDSTVLTVINNGEVRSSDFVVRAGGVALGSEGRKAVLASYERRLNTEVTHPVFGYKVTYRRVLEVQVRLFAAWLLGEVPDYTPFVTR